MRKLVFLFIACLVVSYANGQSVSSSVVATAGNSVETGDINVSWTVGEVAVETLGTAGQTVVLTQGFQQGYFEITSIGDPLNSEFKINVYPNPASDFIWIDLKSENKIDAIVEIYNMEGKLVYNKNWEFANGPNKVALDDFNASQYIIRVSDSSGKILQTFKLIKR